MYKFVEQKGDLEFLEIDTTKIEEVLTQLCRNERLTVWLIPYFDESVESNIEKGYFDFENCKIRIDDLDEILKFIHYFNFYSRQYTEEFYKRDFEYEFKLINYHHFDYKGIFEVFSQKLEIPAKPIKIRNEEDPIERHEHLQAFSRQFNLGE